MPIPSATRRVLIAMVAATTSVGSFARTASAKDQAGPVTWTHFLSRDTDAILTPVTVAKTPLTAMIDTGSTITVVNTVTAQRLGFLSTGDAAARGISKVLRLPSGRDVEVQCGDVILRLPRVLIADLSDAVGPDGVPIDVILGVDAFEGRVLDIDFSGRRVALPDRELYVADPRAARLDLGRASRGERFVTVSIEGSAPLPAHVDTGSSNPLIVSRDTASQTKILEGRRTSTAATGGVDGITIGACVSVRDLLLGQTALADVPTLVVPQDGEGLLPLRLGYPALSRFRFSLDVSGNALWLREDPLRVGKTFDRDISGLGLAVEPSSLRVVHVAAGSPASEGGWAAGETIVAIDGAAIDAHYPGSARAKWRNGPEGRNVTLTLSNGATRRLSLRRYY